MDRYPVTEKDHELIRIGLQVLADNFDDGIHGSCAEYITMGTAISAGEREFDTIVAVHEKHLNCVIPPCGNCRQMLLEYCPDILVVLNDENGQLIKVSARDLLPFAWQSVIC